MINKLRRRFILVAMLSTVVVLVVIVGGMNIMNYRQLQADADRINKMITDNNGTFPNNNGGDRNALKPRDDNQSSDGGSTDQQDTTGKSGDGSTDNQRPDGTLIAFTDCNKALDTFYKNVRISGLVSLAGVVAVFVLVVIFSRLVFRPVAESYQKQKQFITDASHEIKTLLTIIDANVEVIEMMAGENKWTKSTKNQVKGLASLAGQLITLSKMDEGDGMADKMRFSMTDAVMPPEIRRQVEAVLDFLLQRQWQRRIMAS